MASPRLASPFHRLYSSKPTNTSLPLPCLTLGLLSSSSSSSPMRASRNQPARFSLDVLNTGIYECRTTRPSATRRTRFHRGSSSRSFPTTGPNCAAAKSFFESKSVEIAGFAQNQQLGPGDGGLLLGFLFFLSGYFLR
ncbi:hypothetical protein OPV22_001771 [Ensete ventricosum]|uniref:Uncharacterized protein n=1 Tax=Ensete ventricosum TaxID=4639 RepID=A0AAV8RUV3_ENSVE|nr:hypothetical protein OPV22_001771 [Ensete ventricosum]